MTREQSASYLPSQRQFPDDQAFGFPQSMAMRKGLSINKSRSWNEQLCIITALYRVNVKFRAPDRNSTCTSILVPYALYGTRIVSNQGQSVSVRHGCWRTGRVCVVRSIEYIAANRSAELCLTHILSLHLGYYFHLEM